MERALHALMTSYDTPEEVQRQTNREQEADQKIKTMQLWKRLLTKQPRYDPEDNLFFCTSCQWEINPNGHCSKCDEFYPSAIRQDEEEEEEEEEEEDDDDDDDDEDFKV